MRSYDLALFGYGMVPGLLALHLRRSHPRQAVLLLSADPEVGGRHLEPVTAASLSDSARSLVDPFVVASWSGYLTSTAGQVREHAGEVLLLDPLQLALELQDSLEGPDRPTGVRAVERSGPGLRWADGAARTGELVDLGRLTGFESESEILGLDAARSLQLPVLVDHDTRGEPWDALQHVPLGDERVYVRKRRCEGDVEHALTHGFGRLLSDLIA